MEWWVVVSLIISNILDDAVSTLCLFYTVRKKLWLSAGLTVLLNYLVSWSVRNYANQYGYIHPVAWGSGMGCFLAIRFDTWIRHRERLKNLEKARLAKLAKRSSLPIQPRQSNHEGTLAKESPYLGSYP